MDFKEMVKRTKEDLKNFNSMLGMLREYKAELLKFQGYEEIFPEDIQELKLNINRINLNIAIIKNSLTILETRQQQIIVDCYFEKMTTRNIAIKLNTSSETVAVQKKRAIEKLAHVMYHHLEGFEFENTCRYMPGRKGRKSKLIYQYDMGNNFIKRWDSVSECISYGFSVDSIRGCCNGTYKQHKGYKWYYELMAIN